MRRDCDSDSTPTAGAVNGAPAANVNGSYVAHCDAAGKLLAFVLVLLALLERGAENVAERRARIGRAVLGDRFLLFGDFQRLDRDRHLAGLAVELGDAGIELLADLEALGALIAAVARRDRRA